MKVVGFAASSSSRSINKKIVTYFLSLVESHNTEILDLNDYELPLFSVDMEEKIGQPQLAKDFINKIRESDLLVISFAEHNGSYTAAYKNLFDWCSRIDRRIFNNKKMLLFSTSPGRRGADRVLDSAISSIPRFGGLILNHLSIPSFNHNFDTDRGIITNKEIDDEFKHIIKSLQLH